MPRLMRRTEQEAQVDVGQALASIEKLLRQAERDARLLDGRDFKLRRWAEAYRLLELLRERYAREET
jgi:hypothetical protein